jgi:hypothetical protein
VDPVTGHAEVGEPVSVGRPGDRHRVEPPKDGVDERPIPLPSVVVKVGPDDAEMNRSAAERSDSERVQSVGNEGDGCDSIVVAAQALGQRDEEYPDDPDQSVTGRGDAPIRDPLDVGVRVRTDHRDVPGDVGERSPVAFDLRGIAVVSVDEYGRFVDVSRPRPCASHL